MNSEALLNEVVSHITSQTGKLFKTVDLYGGEFSSEEIDATSFTAPAAFVATLGWRKIPTGQYRVGKNVWRTRIAIFIATKDTKRSKRMTDAMGRAETLTALFQDWLATTPSGKPVEIDAENLYNRAIDKKGLALWMVSWWQEIEFNKIPLADLPNLLSVEIHTTGTTAVPGTPDATPNLNVNQSLEMKNEQV